MPIILINKQSGQQVMVKGESVADLWERQKSGRVPIEWPDGHAGDVMKDAVWATKVIPLDEHNKNVEEQKKAKEEQDKAEAEKRQQALEDKEKAKKAWDAKIAANTAWRRKFFLARLVSKKPYPEVA
jgi:hypothetical protein